MKETLHIITLVALIIFPQSNGFCKVSDSQAKDPTLEKLDVIIKEHVLGHKASIEKSRNRNAAWDVKPDEISDEMRRHVTMEKLTQEELNQLWALDVGNRHEERKEIITPEESERLWSMFLNGEGSEKINAFSTIVLSEKIEEWEDYLLQMLHSKESENVEAALRILEWRIEDGSHHEQMRLTNNQSIDTKIREIESMWADDESIQQWLKEYKRSVEDYYLSEETTEPDNETLTGVFPKMDVVKVPDESKLAARKTPEELVERFFPEVAKQTFIGWLWLGLLCLFLILIGILFGIKRR